MSIRRRALLASAIAAPLAAQAQNTLKAPQGKPKADPLSGLRKSRDDMQGMTWYSPKGAPRHANANTFHLYFGIDDRGGPAGIRLKMTYFADDWLFVRRAWAKADGATVELVQQSGVMGWERDNSAGKIWEWSDAPVMLPAQIVAIRQLADAKKVTVRFEGKQYYADRNLSPQVLADLRQMITAYESVTNKPWR